MAEPTPGDWSVDAGPADSWEVNADTGVAGHGKWSAVAQCGPNALGSRPVSPEEAKANAFLMAAAPKMLAALKAIHPVLEGHPDRTPSWHALRRQAFAMLREAIADVEKGQ